MGGKQRGRERGSSVAMQGDWWVLWLKLGHGLVVVGRGWRGWWRREEHKLVSFSVERGKRRGRKGHGHSKGGGFEKER